MLVKPLRQHDLLDSLQRCLRARSSSVANSPLPASEKRSDPRKPLIAAPEGRALRVLVAEDNMVNQRVATLQLQRLGHTVDLAINGNQVLQLLEHNAYDVILMDGQMPELDGYQTTQCIRQNPAYNSIRIIAMTANAMQGDRERCLAVGMDDYVSKPVRLSELQAALGRCLPVATV
jgi:CheY-like chemotaxis protein